MTDSQTIDVEIAGNVRVTVPASPRYMTTFVLQEQGDWFEDEIKFVRHYARPGMRALDIGANYGVYTLSMAKVIGPSGRVWAFEPTSSTFSCLQASIQQNGLANVEPVRCGLSNRMGQATLLTSPNSELNSLSGQAGSGGGNEIVQLTTLDHCFRQHGWQDLDFIKLDAEGEESNILEGAHDTLTALSPLVMFELKHGRHVNVHLLGQFSSMGYETYRLIPGLNVLVRFDPAETRDDFLLNLFCCKNDRAERLEADGHIVRSPEPSAVSAVSSARKLIESLPYGTALNGLFDRRADPESTRYLEILDAYVASMHASSPAKDRVGCLLGAMRRVRAMLAEGEQRVERVITFSRIAFDAGERALGVQLLSNLINTHGERIGHQPKEPLLPACSKYDNLDPEGALSTWLYCSILEQYIVKHAYSCYFSGRTVLPMLDRLERLGYLSEQMRVRRQLIRACFAQ